MSAQCSWQLTMLLFQMPWQITPSVWGTRHGEVAHPVPILHFPEATAKQANLTSVSSTLIQVRCQRVATVCSKASAPLGRRELVQVTLSLRGLLAHMVMEELRSSQHRQRRRRRSRWCTKTWSCRVKRSVNGVLHQVI